MSYQVLARKWRPQRFADIVGQEHITRTLQNAIAQERVGHAYLFVGSRGIGKTTTARIFAKALNCEAGIVQEPCCECQSCREIAQGSSLDVLEIDGASHNKVEHVRDIRENVQYTPSRSRYKVYIIDEVHMLTTQAWNALLKTLEEPPPHVKFFFATTEPHKVLPTIVSRCQRFDLKRIPVNLIVDRLRHIAQTESVNIDDAALTAIARAADGGMRDAQSIFDQIIAFCGMGSDESGPIGEEGVISVFGLASGTELRDLTAAVLGNDIQAAVRVVHGLADRGRDLERLFGDLIHFVRNLMIVQVCRNPRELLDASDGELRDLQALAESTEPAVVQRTLDGLMTEEKALRSSLNKRIYLEVALLRVMQQAHSVDIDDVIARLTGLRPSLGRGAPPAPPAPPPEPEPKAVLPSAVPSGEAAVSGAQEKEPPESSPQPETDADDTAAEESNEAESDADLLECEIAEPDECDSSIAEDDGQRLAGVLESETERSMRPAKFTDAAAAWHSLIEAVAENPRGHQLKNYMQELKPLTLDNGVLQVAYDDEFPVEHVQILQHYDHNAIIQSAFRRLCAQPEARVLIKRWQDGISTEERKRQLVSSPEVMERVKANPFVQQVLSCFGGEIADVRG
jgi:DNA polymerase-3 subunit gamma/tau